MASVDGSHVYRVVVSVSVSTWVCVILCLAFPAVSGYSSLSDNNKVYGTVSTVNAARRCSRRTHLPH